MFRVLVILFFISSPLYVASKEGRRAKRFDWQDDGRVYWAMNCDFFGGDLREVKGPGEQCGPSCASTDGCKAFTWTNQDGGTCYMKSQGFSRDQATHLDNAVCGLKKDAGPPTPVGEGTRVDQPLSKGRNLVQNTIRHLESRLGFDSKKMLERMALIESEFGEDPQTFNVHFIDHTGLHSLGIWQITSSALEETKTNPNLQGHRAQVQQKMGIDWSHVSMEDMKKPLHCCTAAHLYMQFAEKAWPAEASVGYPSDLNSQATKWKKHYNRNSGGLSVEGFIKRCNDVGV